MGRTIAYIFITVLFGSCTFGRAIFRGQPNIDDYRFFETYELKPSAEPFLFTKGSSGYFDTVRIEEKGERKLLDDHLREDWTAVSFLVIRNDTV